MVAEQRPSRRAMRWRRPSPRIGAKCCDSITRAWRTISSTLAVIHFWPCRWFPEFAQGFALLFPCALFSSRPRSLRPPLASRGSIGRLPLKNCRRPYLGRASGTASNWVRRRKRMTDGLPEDPTVEYVETVEGEVTLSIAGGQSMQGWERELMHASADILCSFGSDFL